MLVRDQSSQRTIYIHLRFIANFRIIKKLNMRQL